MPIASDYKFPLFKAEKVGLLSDSDYYYFLMEKIRKARQSLYATVFIVNIRKSDDIDRKVLSILKELEYAHWKGVDVKLIVGSSTGAPLISIANEVTIKYLEEKRFPVRYAQIEDGSLHSKYVVIDQELIIIGSHNWTYNAFFMSKEDSLFCYSKDAAIKLTKEFNYLWNTGDLNQDVKDD